MWKSTEAAIVRKRECLFGKEERMCAVMMVVGEACGGWRWMLGSERRRRGLSVMRACCVVFRAVSGLRKMRRKSREELDGLIAGERCCVGVWSYE